VVREANADNGGLCIDFMHVDCERGGPNLDLLRKIPAQYISYVQLTDGPKSKADSAQSYLAECMTERVPMGEGVIDISAMLQAVSDTGAKPYVAFQVCSPNMANEGAETMARRLRDNAKAVLA
jgi:sugar phosphate isomerase/epimerase